jgi:hypothetical protein
MPNVTAIPPSAPAPRLTRSRSARVSPRPEMTAIATADVHSRSPVTAAGGICPNSLSARPAPYCTETIPVRIIAAGSASWDRASCPRPVTPCDCSPASSGRPEIRASCSWWSASAVVLSVILLAGHCTRPLLLPGPSDTPPTIWSQLPLQEMSAGEDLHTIVMPAKWA